jgi:hypothetical protein
MRVFWAYTSLPDTHQIPFREMPVGTLRIGKGGYVQKNGTIAAISAKQGSIIVSVVDLT